MNNILLKNRWKNDKRMVVFFLVSASCPMVYCSQQFTPIVHIINYLNVHLMIIRCSRVSSHSHHSHQAQPNPAAAITTTTKQTPPWRVNGRCGPFSTSNPYHKLNLGLPAHTQHTHISTSNNNRKIPLFFCSFCSFAIFFLPIPLPRLSLSYSNPYSHHNRHPFPLNNSLFFFELCEHIWK